MTERDLLDWLQTQTLFSPAHLLARGAGTDGADALIDVRWNGKTFGFAAQVRALSTPRAVEGALERAKAQARKLKRWPLVVTPYLSDEQLQLLEREEASGLDMCGNGLLLVPGKLLIYRTGAENKYPRGTLIQNVYRGGSSLVARTFLLQPTYDSMQDLLAEVTARGGSATLSTVSKVCTSLAEDLVIERIRNRQTTQLKLLQPEKLLEMLAANFERPAPRSRFTAKCALDERQLLAVCQDWQTTSGEQVCRTGVDSVEAYAVMGREPVRRFYCTKLSSLVAALGSAALETSRFPNLELLEVQESSAYFDRRDNLLASPLQTYFELQRGDKREQETAEQVRKIILRTVNSTG